MAGLKRTHSGDKAVIAVLLSIEDQSLMKTEMALSINDTSRFMWMKLRVQCSFPSTPTGGEDRCLEVRSPTAFHPPTLGFALG